MKHQDHHRDEAILGAEAGMTVIELLMSIVISGIMLFALTTGILTYMRSANATSSLMAETGELQVAATSFTTDVQSAERVETGVSTCGTITPGETALVELAWSDYTTTNSSALVKVSYVYTGSRNELRRMACRDGVVVGQRTLLTHIQPSQLPSVACDGSTSTCPLTPRRVDLKFPVCTPDATGACPNPSIPVTLTGVRRLP